ncbi:alpha-N-acetylglucosaminidase [uncultured Wocania sp.]|uniref:alpha-N-acetylglucosaminidase n=1 Tax=uncultured Wocania sp. TaxID=2834404 RepID=UPI0030F9E9D4
MKKNTNNLIILILLFLCFGCVSKNEIPQELESTYALLNRLLPDRASQFEFNIISSKDNKDIFELDSSNSKIIINGNTPISIAYGLHYYLRNYCNASFSWSGNQLPAKEEPLPLIQEKVRKEASVPNRYYFNYCTFNYTMAFWDWERWEQEIDWMALHGINRPLALVGQEAVWQNTLKRLDYTDEEIKDFLPGPAYTGWWLLGNLEGWGGPINQSWIDAQAELQKKIVNRMKSLGMTPVYQGFYGMVPNSLKEKYPDAKIHDAGTWLNFKRPGFLIPNDSLFKKVATFYYEEQEKLYGKTAFYQGDPFHEGGSSKGVNVTKAAENIYKAMNTHSSGATWVLQAWGENPTSSLLKGIPLGRALVVDLYAEALPQWGGKPSEWARKESFMGHNWVWSEIPNFGGQTGMTAKLDRTNHDVIEALQHPLGKNMTGIGATPEGIGQDAILYDLLFDLGWETEKVNMDDWLKTYVKSRYGNINPDIEEAYQILRNTVYSSKYKHASGEDGSPPLESVLCARPGWNINKVSAWGYSNLDYDPKELVKAWKLLYNNKEAFSDSDNFRFDLVDVTRQVIANYGRELYGNMQNAFKSKDLSEFNTWSSNFLDLIKDQDSLMGSNKKFLLGTWLDMASKRATSDEERKEFDKNARMLITTWTYEKHVVNDYAYREYAGLLKDYYLPRWQTYIASCKNELEGNKSTYPDFFAFEKAWTEEDKSYPVTPSWNELEAVDYIWNRYHNQF